MEPPEFQAAEKIILRWDSTASEEAKERMIFEGDKLEADQYLRAVDEIQKSMETVSVSGDKVTGAIQIAMARLEDEFRNILLIHTSPLETETLIDPNNNNNGSTRSRFSTESSCDYNVVEDYHEDFDNSVNEDGGNNTMHSYRSTSSIHEMDLVPIEAITDFRSIAERMISAGYLRECIQVYGSVRKSAIDASFRQGRPNQEATDAVASGPRLVEKKRPPFGGKKEAPF
ncbi:hypothetical protein ACHQM5_003152 [Ranunculus cassubicifolius]